LHNVPFIPHHRKKKCSWKASILNIDAGPLIATQESCIIPEMYIRVEKSIEKREEFKTAWKEYRKSDK
jgi:hypothetical protein